MMRQATFLVGMLLLGGLAQARELTPREIYEQASPAVVMVMGHSDSGKSGSGGTGSIIRADGLVLTNAHVVIEEKTGKPYPRVSVFLKPARVTGDTNADLSRMVRAKVVTYSSPFFAEVDCREAVVARAGCLGSVRVVPTERADHEGRYGRPAVPASGIGPVAYARPEAGSGRPAVGETRPVGISDADSPLRSGSAHQRAE